VKMTMKSVVLCEIGFGFGIVGMIIPFSNDRIRKRIAMKKKQCFQWMITGLLILTSCAPSLPVATQSESTESSIPSITPTNTEIARQETLEPGRTITSIPAVINPLTGLPMQDPSLLTRRPLIVKIQNVPRESRPQWGLSLADHVYEYYIEYGDTRFAAVYYGNRPEQVGPVRSARHIDMQLIQMYQAVLLYGGAYEELMENMLSADFGDRLIREGPSTAPAFYRYEPDGVNYLMVNTTLLDPIYTQYKIKDIQPVFTILPFSSEKPESGNLADVVFIRFSGSMYNRWDYNPADGRYYRSSETQSGMDEVYAPHYDRLTGAQIAADNLVILFTRYNEVPNEGEVFDVPLSGSGKAYAVRDGIINELTWTREGPEDLISLSFPDGTPYEYKPGNIWYSVLGSQSIVTQQERNWRFTFYMP
jgi:hypothetical protein